jgi:cytochrome c-type biogenesis protein CcmH/NrfG
MAKKKRHSESELQRAPERTRVPGILAGRPTVGGVLALAAIVLVIGASGGYLIFRFAGSDGQAVGRMVTDPSTPWRARLLKNPQDVEALLGLAHLHLDAQQLDEAEALYRQVLSLEPRNVEAITHQGSVLLGRGQADAALREYERALAIQPDYVHALWDRAHLLQQVMQDYPAAIRAWEAFIRVVGPESQDGKTAQQFIRDAREAPQNASPVDKAFGKKAS